MSKSIPIFFSLSFFMFALATFFIADSRADDCISECVQRHNATNSFCESNYQICISGGNVSEYALQNCVLVRNHCIGRATSAFTSCINTCNSGSNNGHISSEEDFHHEYPPSNNSSFPLFG
ncbi:MAG: hypothetical protein HQK53_13695 [Oligoflexia bacterium]|nr:hypothetical protein [Oligoflexia bacterium]